MASAVGAVGIAGIVVAAIGVGVAIYTIKDNRNLDTTNFCINTALELVSLESQLQNLEAQIDGLETVLSEANPTGVNSRALDLMKHYYESLEYEMKYSRLRHAVLRAKDRLENNFGVDLETAGFLWLEDQRDEAYEIFYTTLEEFGFPQTQSERAALQREVAEYLDSGLTDLNEISNPGITRIDHLISILDQVVTKAQTDRDLVARREFGRSLQGANNLSEQIVAYESELRRVETLEREVQSDIDRMIAQLRGLEVEINAQEAAYRVRNCDERDRGSNDG